MLAAISSAAAEAHDRIAENRKVNVVFMRPLTIMSVE